MRVGENPVFEYFPVFDILFVVPSTSRRVRLLQILHKMCSKTRTASHLAHIILGHFFVAIEPKP